MYLNLRENVSCFRILSRRESSPWVIQFMSNYVMDMVPDKSYYMCYQRIYSPGYNSVNICIIRGSLST